ncbi:MAG: 2,3-diphosphoglycerate-dependent phosphoglycerate mutase [Candidatus Micrarchaeota archaeon]|nr:2,3-diphosphoglycerate-dependent phosphoglycerate mutase [Candidatus Micrarchaeota archaeon]
MALLVLVRHGQSIWNLENKFTGWIDVSLSDYGIEEAHSCAKKLKDFKFDIAYTSVLKRAIDTLEIILKDNNWSIPVIKDKALNERMYGDLQGKNKDEIKKIYGEKQFLLWRRSYDVAPPGGESLKDTAKRVLPFFKKYILKDLKNNKNVLVVAHGNSLRALVMHLEKLTKEEVINLNIPTGIPYIYEFDQTGKIINKKILEGD